MEIAYFKRHQESDFHYYKVVGGSGKNKDGYQEVINFLNEEPIISIEHNTEGSLVGSWCTYEVGISITEKEYMLAYNRAIESNFIII